MGIEEFKKFYSGKRIFLTGHTGFKGSWLLKWLSNLNCEVKGYSLPPEDEFNLFSVINGKNKCQSIYADIRDKNYLKNEILEFQPEIIFHLAAQPLVIESYDQPLYTFEVNFTGTANLLDTLRFYDKPCTVVMITTDKVYFNDESGRPYKETDRLGGYDPYSASKSASEILIDSYRKSFFNPDSYDKHGKTISVARSGNVIGGGDWSSNRIVPDLVRAISSGRELVIRNHLSVRPWQHVLEPLGGYLMLAYKQSINPRSFADAYNFGPADGEALTVEELVKKAIGFWGKGNYRVDDVKGSLHEAGVLRLDIKKAITELGWNPVYLPGDSIKQTIEWYKTYYDDPSVIESYTTSQIINYQQLMYQQ